LKKGIPAMNERVMQFRVGVMILATILIAAILFLLFMGTSPLLRTYTVYVKFRDAPGVTRDTPIRKFGIRIGQVRNVRFADDDSGVIVTAEIDRTRQIYSDEQCRVATSLLMGDASLEFVRAVNYQGEKAPIDNGAVLQGQVAPDMTRSVAGLEKQAAQTLETLNTAGSDMHSVLTRVDRLVAANEERITHMIAETDETMKQLQKALLASNDILGDPKLREQIKQTIGDLPGVLKETRGAIERIEGTFASLEHNMQNMEGLTKPLGERGAGLVEEFDTSMKKLNSLSDNLLRFSRDLNSSDGTLGALLHDRDLYQHVDRVAKNLDELTRDLKPILNDARVFTDKIARHPEMLGVRGAIKKDPGLKGNLTGSDPDAERPQANRWPISGGGQWGVGR
jgi:phospholipid/cholesterol/gamma-HCH transport system substrate-binding protein